MIKVITPLFFLFISSIIYSSDTVNYSLEFIPGSSTIKISISIDSISIDKSKIVIPRSGPGTYDLTNYIAFVDQVEGHSDENNVIPGVIGEGSFFTFNGSGTYLKKISYEVDLKKMEKELLAGSNSSKIRNNYLGLLGYSVFGFIEDHVNNPIRLNIITDKNWPIFSTLKPESIRKYGSDSYAVENFSLLADAQILLGPGVLVHSVAESPIPLFVACYAETDVDIAEIGRRGLLALNGLSEYFGYIPMPHYTLCYEFLIPYSPRHDYGFSMEHLNSMTASFDTSRAIKNYEANPRIGSTVHHIGHSWIPLRSYGTGYRPFEWQTAPMIETIWLNEGFIWYIAFNKVLNQKDILNRFTATMADAPDFIKEKSLQELSRLGSTQYSADFRIGQNLFSRGALLAHDLDKYIIAETQGKKSFNDVALGLLKWTELNQRAFEYDEIEKVMSQSVGLDLSQIWDAWQKAPNKK